MIDTSSPGSPDFCGANSCDSPTIYCTNDKIDTFSYSANHIANSFVFLIETNLNVQI
jgi:hypothetical protein